MEAKIYYKDEMFEDGGTYTLVATLEVEETEPVAVLESLFERFNIGDRAGLRVRSMSVRDVVEIFGIRYECKGAGWERVEFSSEQLIRSVT